MSNIFEDKLGWRTCPGCKATISPSEFHACTVPIDIHDMGVAGISIAEEAHKKTLAVAREAIGLLEDTTDQNFPSWAAYLKWAITWKPRRDTFLARADVRALKGGK
jgi:hypothetical protein